MALMRKFRPDPNAIYVTTQSVAIDVDGVPYVFKHGERLRGSHPAVARLGLGAVVPDGTPESEWPSEIDAAIATLDAELAAEIKATPPPGAPRIDPSTPISALMICVTEIIDSSAGGCNTGRIVLRTDPLVAAASSCFLPLQDRT